MLTKVIRPYIQFRPHEGHILGSDCQQEEDEEEKQWVLIMLVQANKEENLLVPKNFGIVGDGVYRSSFPSNHNLTFLEGLGLRTIVNLSEEHYSVEGMEFVNSHGIKLYHFPIEGHKDSSLTNLLYFSFIPPFDDEEEEEDYLHRSLKALLDPTNRPLLIHCRSGKHRTGCIIGCLRKIKGWKMGPILQEYVDYAGAKARMEDQEFIELFDPSGWVACV